jgi:hypothetical protein
MWRALGIVLVVWGSALAAQSADSSHKAPSRIIGVFDTQTGAPLEGVQVHDAFSGVYKVTSNTGTARLDFLTFRGAAAVVELRKLGYEPTQLVVSRADTAPITRSWRHLPCCRA